VKVKREVTVLCDVVGIVVDSDWFVALSVV